MGSATLDVTYGDRNTFSFTKSIPEETSTVLETTSDGEEILSQEITYLMSTAPKHVIKIDIRYLIAGTTALVLLLAVLFFLSKTKVERERRKRIRRQQVRQFGTYSRLNMPYRIRRRDRRSSFRRRRRRI